MGLAKRGLWLVGFSFHRPTLQLTTGHCHRIFDSLTLNQGCDSIQTCCLSTYKNSHTSSAFPTLQTTPLSLPRDSPLAVYCHLIPCVSPTNSKAFACIPTQSHSKRTCISYSQCLRPTELGQGSFQSRSEEAASTSVEISSR